MSESSAGDSRRLQIIHYMDRKESHCAACGVHIDATNYRTDEAILYHNPPDDFIQCTPPSTQQELDLEGEAGSGAAGSNRYSEY